MKKYRCYIVDDEPLAIRVIEQHLSKMGDFEICGKTTDPVEALVQLKLLQPDLLFVDIQMPELTGIELIAALQNKPEIVVTTAFREYAVEGFEMNVLDYLVKPIPFGRFLKAVEKFLEKKHVAVATQTIEKEAVLYVKSERKTIRILLDDILYVEGIKDYTRIILSGQKIMTKVSIGNFFKALPPGQFVRVHKSFIVAVNKIKAYTAMDVEINGREIPIGRTYKESFIAQMSGGNKK